MVATWHHALDSAGINRLDLRADYSEQRCLVAHFNRSAYIAARLLLPPPVLPHVYAATAFMHHSDNVLDRGPLADRRRNFSAWEERVRTALSESHSDHPVVRPLLRTISAYPQLRECVEEYLTAAPADLDFRGFDSEQDYQDYVDDYSLPAFMLVACLLVPAQALPSYRVRCRTFIEASQRLDFLNDLAEDLQEGRLAIPKSTMSRFGVTRDDLEHARSSDAVEEMIAHIAAQTEAGLRASRPIVEETPPEHRELVRALISLQWSLSQAVKSKGAAVLHGSARPAIPDVLRILLRGSWGTYRHRSARSRYRSSDG